jgi:hypothetical protein
VASDLNRFYAAWFLPVGYVKNIIYKTPATSLEELKLRIVAAIETITPQTLEGNIILLGYLTCHERLTCRSCLAICNLDPIDNQTCWVTLSYSLSSFIFYFRFLKYRLRKPDNNLESLCI